MTEPREALGEAEIVSHLGATELFSLLEPGELRQLAALFHVVQCPGGHILTEPGQVDASLCVVVRGGVVVGGGEAATSPAVGSGARGGTDAITGTRGSTDAATGTRGYGTVIGQHGVFLGAARGTEVRTVMATTLLHADGDQLWDWLRQRPQVLDKLILPEDIRAGLVLAGDSAAVSGEHTMALFRRHWSALLRGLVLPLLLALALTALAWFVVPLLAPPVAILALALIVLGLPILAAAWAFLDYYYDCLIVTNRRIIRIERTPLIDARRHEAPLASIQDVQVLRPSLPARLLGYGDVIVQTASTRGALHFARLAAPERVRAAVFEQIEQGRAFDRERYRVWVAEQLRGMLSGAAAPPMAAEERPAVDEAELPPSLVDRPGFGRSASILAHALRALAWPLPKLRCQQGAVVTWRKHWWVLWRETFLALVAALLLTAALLSLVTSSWRGGPSLRDRPRPALVIGGLWLAAVGLLAWRFEDWRNDLYQLTDEHVIDIERQPLGFFEHRREAPLGQIQDVRCHVPNPWARLLNYGHVEIQTAAEAGSLTFDYVYDPRSVQQEIFARLDALRRHREEAERRRRAEEVRTWLAEYHRLVNDPRSAADPPFGES